MRAIAKTQCSIQMLMDCHCASGQRPAPADRLNLQREVLKTHRVVAAHRPLELQREHLLQIQPSASGEGATSLRRFYAESLVELGDVFFSQETIRCFHRGDRWQAQLLRQPSLPSAEIPLAASPRLWRIG